MIFCCQVPAIKYVGPHCVTDGIMHAAKTRCACEFSCFLGLQITNILHKASEIILSSFWQDVDTPEGICACHLQVEHTRYEHYPSQSIHSVVLNCAHLSQSIYPFLH